MPSCVITQEAAGAPERLQGILDSCAGRSVIFQPGYYPIYNGLMIRSGTTLFGRDARIFCHSSTAWDVTKQGSNQGLFTLEPNSTGISIYGFSMELPKIIPTGTDPINTPSGIVGHRPSNLVISGCSFGGGVIGLATWLTADADPSKDSSGGVRIYNNRLDGCGGIEVASPRTVVSDNIISRANGSGIAMTGYNQIASRNIVDSVMVSNEMLRSAGPVAAGILVGDVQACRQISVTGNHVTVNANDNKLKYYGIDIQANGPVAYAGSSVSVESNLIEIVYANGAQRASGIGITDTSAVLSGNSVSFDSPNPAAGKYIGVEYNALSLPMDVIHRGNRISFGPGSTGVGFGLGNPVASRLSCRFNGDLIAGWAVPFDLVSTDVWISGVGRSSFGKNDSPWYCASGGRSPINILRAPAPVVSAADNTLVRLANGDVGFGPPASVLTPARGGANGHDGILEHGRLDQLDELWRWYQNKLATEQK